MQMVPAPNIEQKYWHRYLERGLKRGFPVALNWKSKRLILRIDLIEIAMN